MWPDAAARQELRPSPVLFCILGVFATYYCTLNPRLFPLRHWLLPVTFASIWNLCTNFYYSDPWLSAFNFTNCVTGVGLTMKLVDIATMTEPPRYDGRVACGKPSVLCGTCYLNTISYSLDVRYLHWHSENPCHRARDTRPDDSYLRFYSATLFLWLKHLFYFDTAQALIMNMGTHGTPQGDTIFRSTLVLTRNYVVHLPHPMLVAVPLTVFGGLSIMNILLAGHYLVTLLAAPLTCLSPYSLPAPVLKKEWPPLFDGPLEATSVRDFWSHRWHALFRRTFLVAGGKPGAAVGGYLGGLVDSAFAPKGNGDTRKPNTSARKFGMRLGGVLGVFLASGLLHDWGVWGIGRGTEFRTITGYFLLQGVIVVMEKAFGFTQAKRPVTKASLDLANGATVNGNNVVTHEEGCYEPVPGANYYFMKVWTFVWVVFPATLMIDAWLRRGAACVVIVPHSLSPVRALLGLWNDFAYRS
ncbi:hypothetical protein FS749_001108 [Ceratobasidium sp. UAMH 11750]|nr:hypothetical protein FS749_001108 [Ceratobasidium sp. UAMH 11750]